MIFIVCALQSEAKPLITFFDLEFCSHGSPFKIYRNDTVALIISGVGKIRAAAAVSYLSLFIESEKPPIWLNVGIGGMANAELGSSFLAHKITDGSSKKSSYPSIVIDLPCETAELLTVDAPDDNHQEGVIFDMEASGFFHTAVLFSHVELVHSYKVISDFDDASIKQVTRSLVGQLIEDKVSEIQTIIQNLSALSESSNKFGDLYEKIVGKWHFSVTEKHQLKRALERLEACRGDHAIDFDGLKCLQSSKEILKTLEEFIQSTPLTYP